MINLKSEMLYTKKKSAKQEGLLGFNIWVKEWCVVWWPSSKTITEAGWNPGTPSAVGSQGWANQLWGSPHHVTCWQVQQTTPSNITTPSLEMQPSLLHCLRLRLIFAQIQSLRLCCFHFGKVDAVDSGGLLQVHAASVKSSTWFITHRIHVCYIW
jgi:hypothetical protein